MTEFINTMNMFDLLREYEYCIGYKFFEQKGYRTLRPSFRYWYADPILVKIGGNTYVFMEMYDKYERKGKIGVSTLGRELSRPKVVINEPFHMSFPNVFEWNNQYYMVPETSSAGQLRIYKMGKDVYSWNLCSYIDIPERDLVDIAVDIKNNDLFFIAGSIDRDNPLRCRTIVMRMDSIDEVLLYSILSEQEDYSFDDRNGGRLFEKSGRKHRVIQHSDGEIYGKYISIHYVKAEDGYRCNRENAVRIIDVNTERIVTGFCNIPYGMHTYGCEENAEVIDIGVKRLSLDGILWKLIRRITGRQMLV